MTTLVAFLLGLAASLAAVFYLLSINDKRQRALRSKATITLPRLPLAGWTLALLPGPILLLAGQTSAFLAWSGALTVCSWIMVSRAPRRGSDA